MLAGAFAGIAVCSGLAVDMETAADFTIGALGDVSCRSSEGTQLPRGPLICLERSADSREDQDPDYQSLAGRNVQWHIECHGHHLASRRLPDTMERHIECHNGCRLVY
jgi:hypothetical protein